MAKAIPHKSDDDWSGEDYLAIVLSATAYFTLLPGLSLALLNQWLGYLLLFIAVVTTVLMFVVIDPKLKRISESYEKHQKEYLQELDRIMKWENQSETESAPGHATDH